MIVCGIDFETTGLDVTKDRITELGMVLFDTSNNWAPVGKWNTFVHEEDYPEQTDEIVKITGITTTMLKDMGVSFRDAYAGLVRFARDAQYFIAHNAAYDRGMLFNECKRHKVDMVAQPWICSVMDLKSNRQFKSQRLAHLALDYGCPVDPRKLHRAVNDVELMGDMLAHAKANFEEMVAFMNTPNIVVQAVIPPPWEDGGKGKAAAQLRGYFWQRPKYSDETFPQKWVRVIKEDELEEEQKTASFTVKRLK